jgi:hypothetical protein
LNFVRLGFARRLFGERFQDCGRTSIELQFQQFLQQFFFRRGRSVCFGGIRRFDAAWYFDTRWQLEPGWQFNTRRQLDRAGIGRSDDALKAEDGLALAGCDAA